MKGVSVSSASHFLLRRDFEFSGYSLDVSSQLWRFHGAAGVPGTPFSILDLLPFLLSPGATLVIGAPNPLSDAAYVQIGF